MRISRGARRILNITVDSDIIVVIQDDKYPELKMPGERPFLATSAMAREDLLPGKGGRFRGDALLKTAVSDDDIGVVIDEVEAVPVKGRPKVGLGYVQSNGAGDACREGTGRDRGGEQSAR
jgi:hypothetical protein